MIVRKKMKRLTIEQIDQITNEFYSCFCGRCPPCAGDFLSGSCAAVHGA